MGVCILILCEHTHARCREASCLGSYTTPGNQTPGTGLTVHPLTHPSPPLPDRLAGFNTDAKLIIVTEGDRVTLSPRCSHDDRWRWQT